MKNLHTLEALFAFSQYIVAGVVLLAVFTTLYVWITPYDDFAEIRENKAAPAISLSGSMLGFSIPLVMASYVGQGLLGFIEWGLICCVVQLLVSLAMHRLLPRKIETNNAAGALVYATAAVCVGLVNAFAIIP